MTLHSSTFLLCLLVFVQWPYLVEGSHFRHAFMSFAPTGADTNTVWSLIARYRATSLRFVVYRFHMLYKKRQPVPVKAKFAEFAFTRLRLAM